VGEVAPGKVGARAVRGVETFGEGPVVVRRNDVLPIAEQLASQIKYLILSGKLRSGDRLPPVRALAGFLRVNRNTVARVYRELKREGYLATSVGRGTFVTRALSPSQAEEVHRLIDRLLAVAEGMGLSASDVQALVSARAGAEKGPRAQRPRLGFVECNPSDLAYFARELEGAVSVPILPVLLSDLSRGMASAVDLWVTTFFHVEEVRRILPNQEVIGLVALPDFSTLFRVAQLSGRTVALVCATQEGVRSKERSIRAVGIRGIRLIPATLEDVEGLREALRRSDAVLASPKVLERIAPLLPAGIEAIPFASVLSDGAIALLRERIRLWQEAFPERDGSPLSGEVARG